MTVIGGNTRLEGRIPRQGRGVRRIAGVTLVELIFTMAVLAILVAIAVPSFRDASLSSRLTAAANDLHASVQIARSEAIKNNSATRLCASANGTSCAASGDWEQGWIVLDVNDPLDASDDVVLHSQAAIPGGFKVVESGGQFELTFQPIGVGASSAIFTVCREDPLGSEERVVSVTATGLAYVTRTEAGACP
jgi:type IV fimbrial biogenesis protein FimT